MGLFYTQKFNYFIVNITKYFYTFIPLREALKTAPVHIKFVVIKGDFANVACLLRE